MYDLEKTSLFVVGMLWRNWGAAATATVGRRGVEGPRNHRSAQSACAKGVQIYLFNITVWILRDQHLKLRHCRFVKVYIITITILILLEKLMLDRSTYLHRFLHVFPGKRNASFENVLCIAQAGTWLFCKHNGLILCQNGLWTEWSTSERR